MRSFNPLPCQFCIVPYRTLQALLSMMWKRKGSKGWRKKSRWSLEAEGRKKKIH